METLDNFGLQQVIEALLFELTYADPFLPYRRATFEERILVREALEGWDLELLPVVDDELDLLHNFMVVKLRFVQRQLIFAIALGSNKGSSLHKHLEVAREAHEVAGVPARPA